MSEVTYSCRWMQVTHASDAYINKYIYIGAHMLLPALALRKLNHEWRHHILRKHSAALILTASRSLSDAAYNYLYHSFMPPKDASEDASFHSYMSVAPSPIILPSSSSFYQDPFSFPSPPTAPVPATARSGTEAYYFPPPVSVDTQSYGTGSSTSSQNHLQSHQHRRRRHHHSHRSTLNTDWSAHDPNRLTPEDAYTASAHLPPQQRHPSGNGDKEAMGQSTGERLKSSPTVDTATMTDVTNGCGNAGPGIRMLNGSVASQAHVTAPMIHPPSPMTYRNDPLTRRSGNVKGKHGSFHGMNGSNGRRRPPKGAWKKLLWVKQSYPDNYTDTETFLDHLQRNPRLRPYDFWPLMADFTVIVQHVSSVVIFVCCFSVIFQERVSPVSVVGSGTICTVLGWVLWDVWVSREHDSVSKKQSGERDEVSSSSGSSVETNTSLNKINLRLETAINETPIRSNQVFGAQPHSSPGASVTSNIPTSPVTPLEPPLNANTSFPTSTGAGTISTGAASSAQSPWCSLSPRNRQRLATLKSAFLIFSALVGLSPILKSLTKSTSSDSIWAIACWLIIINIFCFDYGSGTGSNSGLSSLSSSSTGHSTVAAQFPASLSTNAALMASTVLASRLRSPTDVFSLTVFSVQVFGLFPIFRRHLRAISWTGHIALTVALALAAGGAVSAALSSPSSWSSCRGCSDGAAGGSTGVGFTIAIGMLLGGVCTALCMGICSWWLIGLQKYKNVVIGPWDPARPILRRRGMDSW